MRHDDVVRLDEPAFHPSQQDIQLLHEMFPHISADAIAADLARSGSVQLTSENIMEGRLDGALIQPVPQPPPPSVPSAQPPSADSAPPPTATPAEEESQLLDRRASFSTDILTLPPNQFAATAEEREASLLRRRQQMVELQKKAYLARKNAASASPSPSVSSSSSSALNDSSVQSFPPLLSPVDQPSTVPPSPAPSELPAISSPSPLPSPSTEHEATTAATSPDVSDREEVRRILAERAERISRQRFGAQ